VFLVQLAGEGKRDRDAEVKEASASDRRDLDHALMTLKSSIDASGIFSECTVERINNMV